MKVLTMVLVMFFLVASINAQQKTSKKRMYYTTVVKSDKTRLHGLLYQVEDTKVQLIPVPLNFKLIKAEPYNPDQFNYQDVYAYEIEQIKLKRRGKLAKSTLIGLAVGFTTGFIIGMADGDEPPDPPCQGWCFSLTPDFTPETAEGKGALYGTGLGLLGAAVGAIVGSMKLKIPINGSVDQFKANQPRLKKYAYQR